MLPATMFTGGIFEPGYQFMDVDRPDVYPLQLFGNTRFSGGGYLAPNIKQNSIGSPFNHVMHQSPVNQNQIARYSNLGSPAGNQLLKSVGQISAVGEQRSVNPARTGQSVSRADSTLLGTVPNTLLNAAPPITSRSSNKFGGYVSPNNYMPSLLSNGLNVSPFGSQVLSMSGTALRPFGMHGVNTAGFHGQIAMMPDGTYNTPHGEIHKDGSDVSFDRRF